MRPLLFTKQEISVIPFETTDAKEAVRSLF
jgi:hypothetical protein